MFPGRTIAKVTFYGKSHLFNHVAEVIWSSCLKSKASQISMVSKTLKFSKIHSHPCTGFSTELSFTVHHGKVNWWPENIWFENKTRACRSLLLSELTHEMEHSIVTHTGVCHLQPWSTALWLLSRRCKARKYLPERLSPVTELVHKIFRPQRRQNVVLFYMKAIKQDISGAVASSMILCLLCQT